MNDKQHAPCPFCGGKVDPTGWLRGDGARGPECEGCGSTAPSIEVWDQAAKREPVAWVHPCYLVRREGMMPLAIDATLNQIAPMQVPLYL